MGWNEYKINNDNLENIFYTLSVFFGLFLSLKKSTVINFCDDIF